MFRFLYFAFALVFIAWGGFELVDRALHPTPVTMSLKEYVSNGSSQQWLQLTECTIDYTEAIVLDSIIGDRRRSYYVPLQVVGDEEAEPAVFMQVVDRNKQRLIDQIQRITDEEWPDFQKKYFDELFTVETVTGMVFAGNNEEEEAARVLRSVVVNRPKLPKRYFVAVPGETPRMGVSWVKVIFGLGLIGVWMKVAAWRRERRREMEALGDHSFPRDEAPPEPEPQA